MDTLYAPWRMEYIASGEPKPEVCIFCERPAQGPAAYRKNLILCTTDEAFVIMNKYPYNNGHLMVIPRRHAADPADLPSGEFQALAELLRKTTSALRLALSPHGFNVGMNLGRVAGAGIDQHCHYHVVPRWNGDTNFMPVLAEAKSIGEHLDATYAKLVEHFAHLGEGPSRATPLADARDGGQGPSE